MDDKLVDKFKMYRAEDKHECELIAARINALLTSQSFFLIAGVILYTNLLRKTIIKFPDDRKKIQETIGSLALHSPTSHLPTAIASMALITAILAGIAIVIGCFVLKGWHQDGQDLIRKLKAEGKEDNINEYYYKREQPDPFHHLSIDVFGILLPFFFAVFWGGVILWLLNIHPGWFCAWVLFLLIIIAVTFHRLWK